MPRRMNPDAEHGLAHWIEREGRRPKAFALYQRLAREDPESFDAWYGVAQLGIVLGHRSEAEVALSRIRGLRPPFFDTAILLALTALEAGCGSEAYAFARRAIDLDPYSDLARRLFRRAEGLQTRHPGGPPGGCPPRVFVAPFPLES
jgi:tetratricopeptide (TPR) repeat protein